MAETGALFLIVDDDQTFLSTLSRALRDRGFSVATASTMSDAVAIIDKDPPELAIVDLRLSDSQPMGGIDLVQRLHDADPQTRVVVLTGYGSIATAVRALKSGAVSYLQKPATLAEILSALAGGSEDAVQATVPSLARLEWEHLQRVLTDCNGNISEAARRLGMHRRSLQRKLGKTPPTI
jgi:two-component system, response regulator RegA